MALKRKVKKSNSKRIQKSRLNKTIVSPAKFISKKLKITLTSFIFSLIIFASSWIGYEYFILDTGFFGNFFFILVLLSGFLSLAFFIALLIFLILKAFKK